MGLFSFIGKLGKAVGKVAAPVLKAVASRATGGLSDSILKKIKGNPGKLSPNQTAALVEKTGGYIPRVQRTETVQAEGWGFGKDPVKRKPMQHRPMRPKARRSPAKARTARKAPAPKARKAGGGRKPPTGGLDLRALSASWKAAGKPGTWQGWIQANK